MEHPQNIAWATVYNRLRHKAVFADSVIFMTGPGAAFGSSLEKAMIQAGLSVFTYREPASFERDLKAFKTMPELLIVDGDQFDFGDRVVRLLKAYSIYLKIILIAGEPGPAAAGPWPRQWIAACLGREIKPDQLAIMIKAMLPGEAAAVPEVSPGRRNRLEAGLANRQKKGRFRLFKRAAHKLMAKTNELGRINHYLENILDSCLDAVMILNDQGGLIYMNRGAEMMLGYRLELNPDLTLKHLIPPDENQAPNTVAKLRRAVSRTGHLETWLLKAGGARLYGLVSFDQLKLSSQEGRNEYLLIVKDVGDRRRLEKKLVKQNLKLEKLSITDVLTRLYNRRYLDRKLYDEFQRVKRLGGYMAIIFIDFDNFKAINDHFGHKIGDRVLYQAAAEIGRALRKVDILARWGGEEFLVVLPQTDLAKARVVAERLRKAVDNQARWASLNPGLKVTISLGVAAYPYAGLNTLSDLVDAADKALYKAKRNGKNQVVALDEPASAGFDRVAEAAGLTLIFNRLSLGLGLCEANLRHTLKEVLSCLYRTLNFEADSFGAFIVWKRPGAPPQGGEAESWFRRLLAAKRHDHHSSLRVYPLLAPWPGGGEPVSFGALILSQPPESETFLLNCLRKLSESLAGCGQAVEAETEAADSLIIVENGPIAERRDKSPLNRFKDDLNIWLRTSGFKRSAVADIDRSPESRDLVGRILNPADSWCSGGPALKTGFPAEPGRGCAVLPSLGDIWGLLSDAQRSRLGQAGFRPDDGPFIVRPLWLENSRQGVLIVAESLDNVEESCNRLNFYAYQSDCYHNYELAGNWVNGPSRLKAVNVISAALAGQPAPRDRENFFQGLFEAAAKTMPGIQMAIYLLHQDSQSARLLSAWPVKSSPARIQAVNDSVTAHLLFDVGHFIPPRPSNQSILNLPLGRPGEAVGFIRLGFPDGRGITAYELDLALLIKELIGPLVAAFNNFRPLTDVISPFAFQIISAILRYWLI